MQANSSMTMNRKKLEKLASYLTRAPTKLGSITETAVGRVSVQNPASSTDGKHRFTALDDWG